MKPSADALATPYQTIHEYIRHWARQEPDSPVFVGEGMPPLSYRGLVETIDTIGATLNENGFGRGDRIAILHPDGRGMAAALVAIESNATVVPMDPDSMLGEVALQLRDMRVDALAVAANMDTPARAAAAELGLPLFDIQSDSQGAVHLTAPDNGRETPCKNPGPSEPDDIAVLLATSGTTSHNKIVPLHQRVLAIRCARSSRLLGLTTDDRCLNLLRLFHSGGLATSLTGALVSGGSVAFLTDTSVSGIFDTLEREQVTWVGGAYAHYHAIHPHLEAHRETIERVGTRLRFMRAGTGALIPEIAVDLEKAFGVPVLASFASTEAGIIAGDRPDHIRPDRASVGLPFLDEIAVVDDVGKEVPSGDIGEVVVKGVEIFDGYENDPAANRLAFDGDWFRIGDMGYLDGDGYLFLTGRLKELINRGGEKVSPGEIDSVLLKHPGIASAATFPVPHPTLGEDVAVAIVPAEDVSIDDAAVMTYLRDRLSEQKLPRQLFLTDAIPKGPTGKVQRHKLADVFGVREGADAGESGGDRPATPLEAQLQGLWAASLGRDHVGLHDDYFQLGGDSLQAVELFLDIEKTLGQPLPRSILFEAATVAEMAKRIGSATTARCMVPIQPNGSRPPLFCVHDVNGHVLNFRALAGHLGTGHPVYGIQSVGLDGSEAPLTRIEDMAARYVAEIRAVQPFGPYSLCGYSMGGWIAYEMAQQLMAADQCVAFLGLFDTPSRQGPRRASLGQWLGHHAAAMAGLKASGIAPYLGQRVRNFGEMSRIAVRSRLFGAAHAVGATPNAGAPTRVADANAYAIRHYETRPYAGDAVLFKATPYAWTHRSAHEGWRDLIGGQFETFAIPGGHGDILEEPNVQELAAILSASLAVRQPGHHRASAA